MKKILFGFIIFLSAITIFFLFSARQIQAEAPVSDTEISKKLDDILKTQKDIMEGIKSMKEELNIIKIRVTQRV